MVFRKPYAFLIKNFKKIHIFLLVLCAYIYYKTLQLDKFVNNFMIYLSYNKELEPISKYTSLLLYIFTILVIITFLALLILLKRKKKPWKIYIIPVIEYMLLFGTLIAIQSFFNTYTGSIATSTPRLLSNLLFIFRIPQYLIFIILLVRIIGIDIKNFDFKNDKEYLEMDNSDKEEFEVSVNFDKNGILRKINEIKRKINYFYLEHKFIINIIITIIFIYIIGSILYYFLVTHKTIKENEVLNSNGYSIVINKCYYTNKNLNGSIIEDKKNFVILSMTIRNNSVTRKIDTANFHLVNGNKDFSDTGNTYSNDFSDLGNSYSNSFLFNGDIKNYIFIFKVDSTLSKNNFVLYYQQYGSNNKDNYLRKIKIKLNDVSNIIDNTEKKLNQNIKIIYPDDSKREFNLLSTDLKDTINYNIENCQNDDESDCDITTSNFTINTNYKIMEIPFSSNDYDGEDLIDFSTKYGKIKYIDNNNIEKEINIKNSLDGTDYLGKYLYLKVPIDIVNAKEIKFVYTIRNERYTYKIR